MSWPILVIRATRFFVAFAQQCWKPAQVLSKLCRTINSSRKFESGRLQAEKNTSNAFFKVALLWPILPCCCPAAPPPPPSLKIGPTMYVYCLITIITTYYLTYSSTIHTSMLCIYVFTLKKPTLSL